MKKAYIFCFSIFLLVHGRFVIFAQSCATQSDNQIDFTISIPLNQNILRITLDLTIAAASSPDPSFSVRVPGEAADRAITGFYPPTQIDTEGLPTHGYFIRVYHPATPYQLEIVSKAGEFDSGSGFQTWLFHVSNLSTTAPYKITGVAINSYNTPTAFATYTVSPCNVKPTVAGITSTISTTAPLAVQFSANTPLDSDGTVDHYVWSFGGATTDGLLTEDRTNNLPFTKTYTADGSYTVTLQVIDNDGALSDSTPATPAVDDPVTTTVNTNQRPLVTGISAAISTTTALAVQFSAAGVSDPDADDTIADYVWDFGGATTDGLTIETKHNNTPFTKTYTADGSYPVTLRVVDDKGLSSDSNTLTPAADPVNTTVNTNQRPLVSGINAILSTTNALAVQFSAAGVSDPDADDTITDYVWDFGGATTDGLSTETKHNNTPFTKTYTDDGSFTVTLRVVDDKGLSSDSNTLTPEADPVTATVNTNQRPLVTGINATLSTTAALAVQFSATGVSDPDTDDAITDYIWDFGGATTDGLTTETKHNNTPFTKTYTADGSFPVTLRVVDDKGLSSDSRDTVLILAAEPTLIYEFNDDSYAIYPVPANDAVYVEYHDKAGDNNITVQLYDLYGKLVLTDIQYEGSIVKVDVSSMSAGIYCLTVHCGNGTKTYKIPKL